MTSLFFATTPAPSAAGGASGTFMWIAVFFAVFYFFIIRPNAKRKHAEAQLRDGLKVGDEVITIGGFYGYISEADPESSEIKLELAEGVSVRLAKSAVQRRILPPLPDDWEPEDLPELQGNFDDEDKDDQDSEVQSDADKSDVDKDNVDQDDKDGQDNPSSNTDTTK